MKTDINIKFLTSMTNFDEKKDLLLQIFIIYILLKLIQLKSCSKCTAEYLTT